MSTTAALSTTLRSRIEEVAHRIRVMRLVRGISSLVLILAVTGGLALLADYLFELPALVRAGLFSIWCALGTAWLVIRLVLPLGRQLDPMDLAALIEERYPELAERLTTSVELSDNHDAFHGSPELIALVMQETERRTYRLPFLSAVSMRYSAVLAAVAVTAALVLAIPFAIAPRVYARLAQRFLLAYLPMAEPAPYSIEVTPGDIISAQGKTAKVSVRFVPQQDKAKLPLVSTLVFTDETGKETQQRMVADSDDAFSADIKVATSGHYRIETKELKSDRFAVTSVVPVELAEESPRVAIELPEYARATVETPDLTYGLDDLTVLHHGKAHFEFRFSRPAVNAFMEWKAAGIKDRTNTQILPLTLSDDRLSATWTLPVEANGTFGLVLEAEHGIRTTMAPRTLTVQEDKEPQFFKFNGKEDLRAILPYETIPIDVEVGDDIGVAKAAVEYRITGRDPVLEEIPLELCRDVHARYNFKLTGKVIDGDEVAYRIRVQDNLPAEFGGPHTVYFPADRWLRLKIVKKTNSLSEQEILAQKADIDNRLDRIKAELKAEQRLIFKVHEESKGEPFLNPEHMDEVQTARKENKSVDDLMRALVRDISLTPGLRPLADRVEDVADNEIQKSQASLDKVDPKKAPPDRNAKLENADHNIDQALKRLEDLRKLNERLAQDRIDQNKLQMLAEREKKLAEAAAELAQKDPLRDPTAKDAAENIKKEQAEVAAELQSLTDQSEKLKTALQEDAAEQARKAAEKAKELAEAQRELTDAQAKTDRERNAQKMSDLAKKQQALADKAENLAKQTQQPAQAAKTDALKAEEAKKAADDLKNGDPTEALKHQDKSAQDLDHLANALDHAIDLAKDPREAARQLARLEEGLKKRVDDESRRTDVHNPLVERLKPILAEQKAIHQAAEQLSVPPQNQSAKDQRKEAAKQAEQAVQSLAKSDTKLAADKLEEAKKALERLADQLPNIDQRRQQAQQELNRLRQVQEEVARSAEQAIEQARQNKDDKKATEEMNRRLQEAARKQAEVAESLSKMDVPNQEARQEKTREAMDRALADLLDARKQDVPATQQQAKRELDRLQQALNGQKPADEKARELAKKQRELAAASTRAAADPESTPEKLKELQQKQQQIANETRNLDASEAPQRKSEAEQATQKAEEAANAKPTSAEAQNNMQEAARKLEALARQLEGNESDAARVDRLAKRQAEAAAQAQRQGPDAETQKQQQQITDEARQVRGGEEAKTEKEKALKALTRAQDANAQDKPRTAKEAADALRELADKLNGRDNKPDSATHTAAKPKDQTPEQAARDLAKQQRDLANATQQLQDNAGKQPGEAGKQALENGLKKIAEQQDALNKKASQLPSGQAEKSLEQSHAAMSEAKQALERNDANQAKQKQQDAANALDRLAQALPKEQAPATAQKNPDTAESTPSLPTKEQTEQARALAKEQRDLRDAVQRAKDIANAPQMPRDNPVGELAKQQAEVAKQAQDLAKSVGQEQGEKSPTREQARQAQQNAQQTAKQMQAGSLDKAQQSGKQTAEQLRKLASDLAQTPRGKNAAPDAPDTVERARDLAKKQEDINKQMEPLKNDADAKRTQQTAQQDNLQKETDDLKNTLDQLANKMNRAPQAQQSMSQASQSTKDSAQAQQVAKESANQGNQGTSQKAGSQAAESLEKAAQQAAQAAQQQQDALKQAAQQQANSGQPTPPQDPKSGQETGSKVNEAKSEVGKSQQQLDKGQNQGAQASMQKAADALAQAAEQMGQEPSGKPGDPGKSQKPDRGVQAGGTPDATLLGPDMQKYAGRAWGELPGELRTKIVQDMKAQYGEDYAKMIKLYFEQIAATKASGKQGVSVGPPTK